MHSVLVTTSRSRSVRVDIVRETLPSEWTVDTYEIEEDGLEAGSGAELGAAADGYDAILLRPGCITDQVLKTAPSVRIVAVHGSGYDRVDVDAATDHGVVITHSPGAPGPAVVEHAICMIMMLLRNVTQLHEQTTAGEWDAAKNTGTELSLRTVGVVGLGTIGLEAAQRIREFDASVIAYDPYVSRELTDSNIYPRSSRADVEELGIELVGRDEVFERADVVTLHPPLTDRTRKMVGERELDALAGGYLVNTGRGGLVDEDALAAAVEAGTLQGVALDVLTEEPPDPSNPLLTSPDVIVTPHVAGVTDGYFVRGARLNAEKIRTFLNGGRPETIVNPSVYERV